MRKSILCAIACMGLLSAYAAPAPYPLTVNSRAQTAPPVLVYKANEAVFRVTFTDGDTASDLTGCTPFMSWATNAAALVNSTSSVSVVGISTGLVDFTFSPSSVNYTAGRYVYEVGVLTAGGLPRVYRQGTFTIYDSPVGAGAGAIAWSTNVTWSSVAWIGLPDVTINGVVGNIKTSVVYTVTADSAQTAVSVTGVQSNLIATALQPADTNGWETGSHASLLPSAATNGWTVSAHAAWLTNAWQNPLSAADWGWINDGEDITLLNNAWYSSSSIQIPDMLDGLPVRDIGVSLAIRPDISTVTGGEKIKALAESAFGASTGLVIVDIPYLETVGGYAFEDCTSLQRVYFNGRFAPPEATDVFLNVPANQVTNYVLNPTSTGWGATWNGMPVVRMPLYGDGSNITGITAAQAGAVATNAVRTAGCTDLGSATNLIITGNTGAFLAYPTADYGVSVAAGSIFDGFSLTINSTNIPTYASNIYTQNSWTATARNILSFVPYTNGLWNVYGRGL